MMDMEMKEMTAREPRVVEAMPRHCAPLAKIGSFRLLLAAIATVLLYGCGKTPAPESLEPVIELFEAEDVGRTEATVSARIEKRSSAEIVRVAFTYGENGKLDKEIVIGNVSSDTAAGFAIDKTAGAVTASDGRDEGLVAVRLKGLTPGREYGYCLEVATKRATVKSALGCFTTEPNMTPSVSGFTTLSTGPTGVILEFEITDDGGEPLRAAGCEVYCKRSDVTSREYLAPEYLSEGVQRIYLTGLETATEYTLTPFAANSIGEERGEGIDYTTLSGIVLTESGMLSRLFGGDPNVDMDEMRIAGDMDGDDFRFLRSVLGAGSGSRVGSVDLTDVRICAGGESYDGSRYTVADEVTTGLFAGCEGLRDIILPASATVLARDALAQCGSLERITVSAGISCVVPSADCPRLQSIEVSEANGYFSSVDGVLFNRGLTEIVWFPCGKGGDYTLPSGITALGENSFYGTSITGLVIPESVTSISRGAFAGSALREITLPGNLTNVSEGLLQNCALLETLRLGSGTEYIGAYAFDGTRLKALYVEAEVPPVVATEGLTCRDYPLLESCTLYVAAGSRGLYRNHKAWGRFENIEEM